MKLKHYLYILSALAVTSSCSNELGSAPSAFTVGEADNAIVLNAGITNGGADIQTRAGAEANHAKHVAFSSGTKAALQINGDWWKQGDDHATPISQPTTATIGDETATDSKHNSLEMSPQLYWDDYGTADPSNTPEGKGRKKGLTVYGVAVDGVTTAPVVSTWTAMPWTVTPSLLDQSNATTYWKNQDLLISNNVKEGTGDGTYKFDDSPRSKLLEFTHAMSKITVRLIASDGFPTTGSVGNTTNKFENAPEVVLTSNEGESTSNTEWPYTSGNVNIMTGAVTGLAGSAKVKMHAQETPANTYTAIYDALVMPGSCFGTTDDAIIACINADENIYYVKAKEIREKLTSPGYATEPGKNYIITVNVKKTKIEVTATIKNWEDVEADPVEPVINVTTTIGSNTSDNSNAFNSFDFYLSDDAESNCATNYNSTNRTATASAPSGDTPTDGTQAWTFSPLLYWPSHSTHYHMRGVYPSNTPVSDGKISVTAGDYNATSSPSNIMVGAPVFTDANKNCNNSDHTSVDMSQHGICAREGKINLNFNYMMAQVEVRLTTPLSGNDVVNLANAKVEIIDGYTAGNIDVHTKTVAVSGSTSAFTLNHIADENDNYRHSIVVPQALTHDDTDLKFRITIYKSGSTTEVDDVYTAVIKNIKVKDPSTADVSKSITAWDSGKHYVYTLDMRKTEVKVSATINDWIKVTASEDVWF